MFDLEPGVGAYMPSTSPHMVENDENPSITMGFTYYTDATRRNSSVHSVHERLRNRFGINLAPVGTNSALDSVLYVGDRIGRMFQGIVGKGPRPDTVRYAHAEVG